MKLLYSENGFEQDMEPQVCLEGSNIEFENLMNKIKESIHNNKEGEIDKIYSHDDSNSELILINKSGDNQIIKRIENTRYIMSLDSIFWNKILYLIVPLVSNKGYQFIEFDTEVPIAENLGLIFRSV